MSGSSHLDFRDTDSQALSHLDSVSLPSEPPDIRNWFSSYVYESPELNTLDGFQDFDGPGESCLEEEKNGESGGSLRAGKSGDALLAASEKSSDGIKFNKSVEFECSKSDAVVTGSSESPSFSSEPPDIKNWFASYCYESPLLDTTHDFATSDYKEREDGKLCDGQMSCRQDEKDLAAFIDVKEHIELCSQSRDSDVVVKCTDLVKDTKLDSQSVCKDVHKVALKPKPCTRSQLTSDEDSEQTLSGQIARNNDHDNVEMSRNTDTCFNDYDGNWHCSLTDGKRPMPMNLETNIGSWDGKSVHKSIGRMDLLKDSIGKEDLHETVSPGTLDLTAPKGDSRARPSGTRSNEKENEENGFISIRKKSSQSDPGNVTRRVPVEVESLKNVVKPSMNHEKDANLVRKVLAEISNFRSPIIQESTGKWRCPQKKKPNHGPPLKQLRLDQWFNRV